MEGFYYSRSLLPHMYRRTKNHLMLNSQDFPSTDRQSFTRISFLYPLQTKSPKLLPIMVTHENKTKGEIQSYVRNNKGTCFFFMVPLFYCRPCHVPRFKEIIYIFRQVNVERTKPGFVIRPSPPLIIITQLVTTL